MKKIFYFIASAIVALGAVACQNDIEEGIDAGQQTEGLSITANIGDMTRVAVEDSDDANYDKKLTWEGNETLTTDKINGVSYEFTNTPEAPHTFTCTQDGVEAAFAGIEETTFYFNDDVYTSGDYSLATDNKSFYLMGEYTKGSTSVEMELWYAVFHFTCDEPVTLKYYNPTIGQLWGWNSEYTFPAGEHYVGAYVSNNGAEHTLEAWIDGVMVKSITREFPSSKIYNLGHIEAPAAPAEKVYLVPNADWKQADAWFAAYFWNATTSANKSITMTDAGADGIYECEVPADMDKVIFCRMNPEYTEFGWNVTEGEGESFKLIEEHVWNQTADLEIGVAPDNYYYIIGWESGLWGDENTDPTASVAGQTSEWALVGAFNGWKDNNFITTATAGVVVLENVTMKAAEGFLVRKPSTDWADKYGASSINYLKANHFITTSKDGGDMCLEADGTYDIYFDANTKNIYIMTAGTDYTTATKQTTNGQEPENEEVEVTENVLYLKPNSNWKVDNARFAAYFFKGSTTTWVSMTDSDSDGIYEVNIPTGYNTGNNVIFCRMNPSTTANNWNNKWNQTADLTIPTDGKNLYTVKDGTWDKGGGTWSTK